ncbi:MAG: hypothetical protein ABIH59_01615 [archaeon]
MEFIKKSIEKLENELPKIIKKIAIEYNVKQYIENQDFIDPRINLWHQFGLITHTKRTRKIFLEELDNFLKQWEIYKEVNDFLNKKIKGISQKDLLEISFILHDLGKIPLFGDERDDRLHERASRDLILNSFIKDKLKEIGLEEEHIKKIARYVGTHGVIGDKIRVSLKERNEFNINITKEKINLFLTNLAEEYSDVKEIIGIFFLCDSLGKVDPKLPGAPKKAVIQLPINIKLAQIYLKIVFSFH